MRALSIVKSEKGFGTLEVLISLAVIVSALSAVVIVVFGNQNIKLDDELNNQALYRASEIIEKSKALAEIDFNSIISSASAGDLFSDNLYVADISPCRKDVSSSVYWMVIPDRPQNVFLATSLVSRNELEALGGDCDLNSPISDWWYPRTFISVDLKDIGGPNNGTSATSIDIIRENDRQYAILSTKHSTPGVNDIWAIDITDIADDSPPYIASLAGSLNTSSGLNDVDVAGNFGFAANDESTKQFHIVDLTDLSDPRKVSSVSLPFVTGACPDYCPQGKTIFYYGERIYIGTHRTNGHEFHVFSALAPYNHLGSLEINHNINDIIVRGDYAYLATSDNGGELMIIDISNPSSLLHPDSTGMKFNASGDHDGTAIYLLGNKLYLGRKSGNSTEHNLFVLDVSNPSSIVSLGSKFITRNPVQPLGLTAIVVSGDFAFLGTDDSNAEFQVFRVNNPAKILNCSEPEYPGNFTGCGKYDFPAKITDLEYYDNLIYAAVESNNAFRVIFDDLSLY